MHIVCGMVFRENVGLSPKNVIKAVSPLTFYCVVFKRQTECQQISIRETWSSYEKYDLIYVTMESKDILGEQLKTQKALTVLTIR